GAAACPVNHSVVAARWRASRIESTPVIVSASTNARTTMALVDITAAGSANRVPQLQSWNWRRILIRRRDERERRGLASQTVKRPRRGRPKYFHGSAGAHDNAGLMDRRG